MADCIHHYFRDDEELSYEDWNLLFDKDLDAESEKYDWDVRSVVYTDYGNGRDIDLNGHEYKSRTDCVYDTAKELLEDMIFDGNQSELIDAIQGLPEEEAARFVSYLNRAQRNKDKFILKDDRDF